MVLNKGDSGSNAAQVRHSEMKDVGARTGGIGEKETDMDDMELIPYTTFHKDSLCFTGLFLYWNCTLTLVSVVTIPLTKVALR
jgi:hypothetical protein